MDDLTSRSGRDEELEALRDIERSAGWVFADYGMSAIADDDPPSEEVLGEYCQAGRLRVITDEHDQPVAYLIVDLVDGCAHIEQVSAHPDHAGQGLGRRLIEWVFEWAVEQDLSAVTPTTFSEIPWNRPYYERLGFQVIPEEHVSDGLRLIRQEEKENGLDAWPRVCMAKRLGKLEAG